MVLPDDSACERGERRIIHNTHQHTTYTTTISYLILIPLFEGLGTKNHWQLDNIMILDGVMNVILVCGVYWMTVYQVYVGVLGMLS